MLYGLRLKDFQRFPMFLSLLAWRPELIEESNNSYLLQSYVDEENENKNDNAGSLVCVCGIPKRRHVQSKPVQLLRKVILPVRRC